MTPFDRFLSRRGFLYGTLALGAAAMVSKIGELEAKFDIVVGQTPDERGGRR